MADTPRTVAYLIGSEFQSGQTATISSQYMRDLIMTLKLRTGNAVQNFVTAPEYGADPTGVADSTAAFAAALSGGATALVPPGTYRLNNLVVPTGSSIVGWAPIGYGTAYGAGTQTVLAALNSSTVRILNVNGALNVRISGVQLDADYNGNSTQNTTCDCISGGCTVLCLDNVTLRFGRYGVGGAAGGNAYTVVLMSSMLMVYGCVTGLGDIVDGYLTNLFLCYNTAGATFGSTSSAITIAGGRVEWNSTDGIQNSGTDLTITAVLFDRNYQAALYLNASTSTNVTGCEFRRNGRNLDSSSCHVRLNNAVNSFFTGCTSRQGQDDGATGSFTPAVWLREVGTGSSQVSFVGCDLSGTTATVPQTLAAFYSGTQSGSLNLVSNYGMIMDERTIGFHPCLRGGFAMQDYYENDVGTSATITQTFYHNSMASYTCESFCIRLTVRDSTAGNVYTASFIILIDREGTTPTMTASAVIGQIGTAGYIAWGSGTISLSWTSIAADGSSYVLNVHNTSATNTQHVRIQIL